MQKITAPQKALIQRLFLTLFTMLMAGVAWAGPKEDTKAAYERKDYKLVVKIVNPLAIEGEAWAQIWLADAYIFGQGVVQDYVKAYSWYHLSTVNGDTSAVKNRDYVAKRMTAQQIADAQKLARDCQARQFKECD
jgi:TPR repeat protein